MLEVPHKMQTVRVWWSRHATTSTHLSPSHKQIAALFTSRLDVRVACSHTYLHSRRSLLGKTSNKSYFQLCSISGETSVKRKCVSGFLWHPPFCVLKPPDRLQNVCSVVHFEWPTTMCAFSSCSPKSPSQLALCAVRAYSGGHMYVATCILCIDNFANALITWYSSWHWLPCQIDGTTPQVAWQSLIDTCTQVECTNLQEIQQRKNKDKDNIKFGGLPGSPRSRGILTLSCPGHLLDHTAYIYMYPVKKRRSDIQQEKKTKRKRYG